MTTPIIYSLFDTRTSLYLHLTSTQYKYIIRNTGKSESPRQELFILRHNGDSNKINPYYEYYYLGIRDDVYKNVGEMTIIELCSILYSDKFTTLGFSSIQEVTICFKDPDLTTFLIQKELTP